MSRCLPQYLWSLARSRGLRLLLVAALTAQAVAVSALPPQPVPAASTVVAATGPASVAIEASRTTLVAKPAGTAARKSIPSGPDDAVLLSITRPDRGNSAFRPAVGHLAAVPARPAAYQARGPPAA